MLLLLLLSPLLLASIQAQADIAPTRLPTFSIVGVPKSGTSALHHYLANHPHVAIGPKEARKQHAAGCRVCPAWTCMLICLSAALRPCRCAFPAEGP